jgi:negative regulator of flagellin synthesis FlgM
MRPIGAVDVRTARQGSGPRESTKGTGTPAPTTQLSGAVDPGEAPVDTDRVAVIRRAVEQGAYPLVPARIADAIIAAGMLLLKKGD